LDQLRALQQENRLEFQNEIRTSLAEELATWKIRFYFSKYARRRANEREQSLQQHNAELSSSMDKFSQQVSELLARIQELQLAQTQAQTRIVELELTELNLKKEISNHLYTIQLSKMEINAQVEKDKAKIAQYPVLQFEIQTLRKKCYDQTQALESLQHAQAQLSHENAKLSEEMKVAHDKVHRFHVLAEHRDTDIELLKESLRHNAADLSLSNSELYQIKDVLQQTQTQLAHEREGKQTYQHMLAELSHDVTSKDQQLAYMSQQINAKQAQIAELLIKIEAAEEEHIQTVEYYDEELKRSVSERRSWESVLESREQACMYSEEMRTLMQENAICVANYVEYVKYMEKQVLAMRRFDSAQAQPKRKNKGTSSRAGRNEGDGDTVPETVIASIQEFKRYMNNNSSMFVPVSQQRQAPAHLLGQSHIPLVQIQSVQVPKTLTLEERLAACVKELEERLRATETTKATLQAQRERDMLVIWENESARLKHLQIHRDELTLARSQLAADLGRVESVLVGFNTQLQQCRNEILSINVEKYEFQTELDRLSSSNIYNRQEVGGDRNSGGQSNMSERLIRAIIDLDAQLNNLHHQEISVSTDICAQTDTFNHLSSRIESIDCVLAKIPENPTMVNVLPTQTRAETEYAALPRSSQTDLRHRALSETLSEPSQPDLQSLPLSASSLPDYDVLASLHTAAIDTSVMFTGSQTMDARSTSLSELGYLDPEYWAPLDTAREQAQHLRTQLESLYTQIAKRSESVEPMLSIRNNAVPYLLAWYDDFEKLTGHTPSEEDRAQSSKYLSFINMYAHTQTQIFTVRTELRELLEHAEIQLQYYTVALQELYTLTGKGASVPPTQTTTEAESQLLSLSRVEVLNTLLVSVSSDLLDDLDAIQELDPVAIVADIRAQREFEMLERENWSANNDIAADPDSDTDAEQTSEIDFYEDGNQVQRQSLESLQRQAQEAEPNENDMHVGAFSLSLLEQQVKGLVTDSIMSVLCVIEDHVRRVSTPKTPFQLQPQTQPMMSLVEKQNLLSQLYKDEEKLNSDVSKLSTFISTTQAQILALKQESSICKQSIVDWTQVFKRSHDNKVPTNTDLLADGEMSRIYVRREEIKESAAELTAQCASARELLESTSLVLERRQQRIGVLQNEIAAEIPLPAETDPQPLLDDDRHVNANDSEVEPEGPNSSPSIKTFGQDEYALPETDKQATAGTTDIPDNTAKEVVQDGHPDTTLEHLGNVAHVGPSLEGHGNSEVSAVDVQNSDPEPAPEEKNGEAPRTNQEKVPVTMTEPTTPHPQPVMQVPAAEGDEALPHTLLEVRQPLAPTTEMSATGVAQPALAMNAAADDFVAVPVAEVGFVNTSPQLIKELEPTERDEPKRPPAEQVPPIEKVTPSVTHELPVPIKSEQVQYEIEAKTQPKVEPTFSQKTVVRPSVPRQLKTSAKRQTVIKLTEADALLAKVESKTETQSPVILSTPSEQGTVEPLAPAQVISSKEADEEQAAIALKAARAAARQSIRQSIKHSQKSPQAPDVRTESPSKIVRSNASMADMMLQSQKQPMQVNTEIVPDAQVSVPVRRSRKQLRFLYIAKLLFLNNVSLAGGIVPCTVFADVANSVGSSGSAGSRRTIIQTHGGNSDSDSTGSSLIAAAIKQKIIRYMTFRSDKEGETMFETNVTTEEVHDLVINSEARSVTPTESVAYYVKGDISRLRLPMSAENAVALVFGTKTPAGYRSNNSTAFIQKSTVTPTFSTAAKEIGACPRLLAVLDCISADIDEDEDTSGVRFSLILDVGQVILFANVEELRMYVVDCAQTQVEGMLKRVEAIIRENLSIRDTMNELASVYCEFCVIDGPQGEAAIVYLQFGADVDTVSSRAASSSNYDSNEDDVMSERSLSSPTRKQSRRLTKAKKQEYAVRENTFGSVSISGKDSGVDLRAETETSGSVSTDTSTFPVANQPGTEQMLTMSAVPALGAEAEDQFNLEDIPLPTQAQSQREHAQEAASDISGISGISGSDTESATPAASQSQKLSSKPKRKKRSTKIAVLNTSAVDSDVDAAASSVTSVTAENTVTSDTHDRIVATVPKETDTVANTLANTDANAVVGGGLLDVLNAQVPADAPRKHRKSRKSTKASEQRVSIRDPNSDTDSTAYSPLPKTESLKLLLLSLNNDLVEQKILRSKHKPAALEWVNSFKAEHGRNPKASDKRLEPVNVQEMLDLYESAKNAVDRIKQQMTDVEEEIKQAQVTVTV
jgi:hypothetical protein